MAEFPLLREVIDNVEGVTPLQQGQEVIIWLNLITELIKSNQELGDILKRGDRNDKIVYGPADKVKDLVISNKFALKLLNEMGLKFKRVFELQEIDTDIKNRIIQSLENEIEKLKKGE